MSTCFINCYSQNWLWAKNAVGTAQDAGTSVSTDAAGNVFITGYFSSPTITFGSTTLTNAGGYFYGSPCSDLFIAKYDANGNVLWAKSAGGTYYDAGRSVCTDASGNVFVTGQLGSPTITFGSTTLTNVGSSDLFIVKYDTNGNELWAKSAGGINYNCQGFSVSADAGGNVFVTGQFGDSNITFDSIMLSSGGNSSSVFIVKYDVNGNVLWAKSAGGGVDNVGTSVSADAGGNVVVTGTFYSSTLTFGSTTLINAGSWDIFIAKYDTNGNVLWAKSVGGTANDQGNSVSTNADGNIFVTGFFGTPTINFDSITLTNAGPGNYYDLFIAKYDAGGNVLWAKSAGGTSKDGGYSVSADAGGNVFVTGFFYSSSITFGSTTLTPSVDNCISNCDPMFIAKYDANGNVLCASALGSGGPIE